MITIRVDRVSPVNCVLSLIVAPLLMFVLILLKTNATGGMELFVIIRPLVVMSLSVSTSWSSLLLDVSPFTGTRGEFGNGANRKLTLLVLEVLKRLCLDIWTLSPDLSTVRDLSLVAIPVVSLPVVVICSPSIVCVVPNVLLNSPLCLVRNRSIPLGDVLRLLKLNIVRLCYVTMLDNLGF